MTPTDLKRNIIKSKDRISTYHISVPYPTRSKLITSGATNSGVPNKTFNCLVGSNFLAKPKSIIFIR